MEKVIEFAHRLLKQVLGNSKDEVSVDMTAGNGQDTVFLSQLSRKVYAFDIQEIAIKNTSKKLNENRCDNVVLINNTHENVDIYVLESIKAAIFNLGYLPGGDKRIHTNHESVLIALKKVLGLLVKDGICLLVMYPGYDEGQNEVEVIEKYLKDLDQHEYEAFKYEFINQINFPPFLLGVRRVK